MVKGVCMVKGGMHGEGGYVVKGGMHGNGGMHGKGGMCGMHAHPLYEIQPVNALAVRILLECILAVGSIGHVAFGCNPIFCRVSGKPLKLTK